VRLNYRFDPLLHYYPMWRNRYYLAILGFQPRHTHCRHRGLLRRLLTKLPHLY
jgi:hypothetical protein